MTAEKAQGLGYRLARDEINDSFMAGALTDRTNVAREHIYWVKETMKVIRE